MAFPGVAVAVLVLEGVVAGVTRARARRVARLPPGSGDAPPVTVIVPARNEAVNIAACVQSVLSQAQVPLTLRVVDDGSTDGTAALAREAGRGDARLSVMSLAGPPPGWAGKAHAVTRGAEDTATPWLLFLDADTCMQPGTLAAALAFAHRDSLDVVSLGLVQSARSVAWPLLYPASLQLMLLLTAPDGRGGTRALAAGQFLLVRRAAYDRVGGFGAVRGSTADDLDFVTAVRNAGGRVQLAWGEGWLRSTQQASWGDFWRSWRKSFHGGAGRLAWLLVPGGWGLGVWGVAVPYLLGVYVVQREWRGAVLMAGAWGVQAWGRRGLDRALGVAPGAALGAPVARTLLGGVMLDAGVRAALRRPSLWKDRPATR